MYSATFWEIFFSAAAFVFILPTIIGLIRRVDNIGILIGLNLLGIPTLLAGWVAAMLFACIWPRRPRPIPARQPYPASSASKVDYDPGPMRGTPFESLARSGFWAEDSEPTGSRR